MNALITQQEAAKLLGVSMPTYYKIAKSPDFPLVSFGRHKKVLKEKLEEWVQNKSCASLAPCNNCSHCYSCVKETDKRTSEPREEFQAYDQNAIVMTVRDTLDAFPGATVQMSVHDFYTLVYKHTGEKVAATIQKFGRMVNNLVPSLMEFDGIALSRPYHGEVRFYRAKTKEVQLDIPNRFEREGTRDHQDSRRI